MIIEAFFNFIAGVLANIIGSIPPPPEGMLTALDLLNGIGRVLSDMLAPFSPIVPWAVVTTCVAWWLGALTFYGVVLVIRLVLWILDR